MIIPTGIIQTKAASDPYQISASETYAANVTDCVINDKRITVTGTSPSAEFSLDTKWSKTQIPSKLIATYQISDKNSEYALSMRFDFMLNGKTVHSADIPLTRGYKYYSSVADISDYTGYADKIRITYLTECEVGDTLYFASLYFSDESNCSELASKLALEADTVIAKYTEEELDSSKYELNKYMLPYWDTNIVYNEGVYPLLNKDGTMSPVTLMYDIGKVISVRSSTLKTEYKEGIDYIVTDDGKLQILTTGSIPCVKYSEHYFSSQASNTYKMLKGGWVRFQEGTAIPLIQLAVTYTVKEDNAWFGFIPENQGEKLSKTRSKLESGKKLNIVFFGDSITNGGNSSSCLHIEPYAEYYTTMFEKELTSLYPEANITCTNTSVSGGGWPDAYEHVDDCIVAYKPDLVILALGTNDYQFQDTADEMSESMNYVVDRILSKLSDCEIIIVSPMYSNPECFKSTLLDEYSERYYEKANGIDRVVVADVTSVHEYLLTRKSYTDMSANNVCHLNDFFARVYSQTLIRTVMPEEANDTYKTIVKNKLADISDSANYYSEQQAKINNIKNEALEALNKASTTDECRRILRDTKYKISFVKTKSEIEESKIDYINLIFDKNASIKAIDTTYGTTSQLNDVESAAEIRITNTSNPGISISYPTDNTLNADSYPYIVITYKIGSSTSTEGQVFFSASSDNACSEERCMRFDCIDDNNYHSVIFDLSKSDFWSGDITKIRINPFNAAALKDTFFISSLCLCQTEQAASSTAQRREQIANGTYIGEYAAVVFDNTSSLNSIDGIKVQKYRGDVNNDGSVSSNDSKIVKALISGANDTSLYDADCLDVNCDGIFNAKDSRMLVSIISGNENVSVITSLSTENRTFDSNDSCAVYHSELKRYMTFRADRPTQTRYFSMVYKAVGTDGNVKIYFGETSDCNVSVKTIALDGIWDRMTVEIPETYIGECITLDFNGLSVSIDSMGFFETEECAQSYTYNRLWERKSEKVYSDNIIIKFDEKILSKFTSINHATVEATSDNVLKFTVSKNKIDPYAYLDISELSFSADEYKYAVYKYMLPMSNSSTGSNAEIFFCSGNTKVPTAGCSKIFSVTKDGLYHNQIIDLTSSSFWFGNVYGIRLDFFTSAELYDTAYVSQITFCKTLKDVEFALN